ncbi:MAG: EpsI family protein [Desulfobacterium sp.]
MHKIPPTKEMHSGGGIKALVVCLCLAAAGLMIQLRPVPGMVNRSDTLQRAVSGITGWTKAHDVLLDDAVVSELQLDDYFNAVLNSGRDSLALYIGYYYTAKKVGAAHDPLVCFPGQGWKVFDRHQGEIKINALPGTRLSYSVMTGQLGSQKDLILYWFQAHDKTSAGTLGQKLHLLWKRMKGEGENNAFVRITVPLGKGGPEEAEAMALDFVQRFYPVFLEFVLK